ncbi:LADA_0D11430g1_1 [Lachancea dasiensis]|uniref:LADA_0D11430g1_1 n=1 Tax=Lachancea dasiensis TaxID=1072105 RepID=A0A1G4J8D9_9SACH|nr:LADA_0D11430g1_1 [Lachancea dasiensis]
MDHFNTRVAYVRVDNLPPGKNWRQVKYMVGGMIHHSCILQVKMLPPVQSIVPPFMPFQSCIVSLKKSETQLNRLLMELNGYTWEYYRLMAYAVPPLHVSDGAGFLAGPPGRSAAAMLDPMSPPGSIGMASHGGDVATASAHMMMPFAPMPPIPSMYFSGPPPPQSISQENYIRQPNQQHGRKMRQVFSEESFRRQMSSRGMHQLLLEGFPPCLHWDVNGAYGLHPKDTSASQNSTAVQIRTSHPESYGKLKWTVLKDFIKLKCRKLLEMESSATAANTREFYVGVYEDAEIEVDVEIVEAQEEKKSTPQNTDPKNEIDMQQKDSTEPSDEISKVSEDLENLDLNTGHRVVSATVYKAIVGFHARELCDACAESLQNQEYSLGYRLKVNELSPLEY